MNIPRAALMLHQKNRQHAVLHLFWTIMSQKITRGESPQIWLRQKLGQRLVIIRLSYFFFQTNKKKFVSRAPVLKEETKPIGSSEENCDVDASIDNAEWFTYFHLQEHQSGAL